MIKTYLFSDQNITEDVPIDNWQSLVEGECKLLWVDVRSLSNDEMDSLAKAFSLHSVAIESCVDGYRRPHLYEFPDHFYINFTTLKNSRNGNMKPSELHLFAGEKFILTITKEKDSSAVDKALSEFKDLPNLCERGPMYAVYLLTEDLVETYFPIVEKLDDEADAIETEMLDKADKESIRKLFNLKRHTFELRKLLGPQRDIFNELARRDFPFIKGENQLYFQDSYNRMVRIFDVLDTTREILSGSLDIYLSTVSNKLNEVMKVLTVAATILMTISFITGFFGMNFVHLPWLKSPNAFQNISLFMLGIVIVMMLWFKRKGWM
jgi:magnesium transporter